VSVMWHMAGKLIFILLPILIDSFLYRYCPVEGWQHDHRSVAVTLWSCIWEMLGSILGQVTGYPDWDCCSFPHSLQEDTGSVRQLDHDCLLPNHFQFIIHKSSHHLILCSLHTDSVVK
jgi:hypothetical protein